MDDSQHLTKLAIRGFRGLSSLELDGLGAFNLLVGANDVGKTSVLEGIFLLTGSTNLELPLRVNLWRNYPVQEFDDLSYLFHDQEVDTPIQLTAHSGRARRSLSISAVYDHGPTEQPPVQGAPNGDSGRLRGSEGGADSFSSSTPSRPRALQYESTVERPQREALQFSGELAVGEGKFELTKQNPEMIIPARFLTPGPGYDSVVIGEVVVKKKSDELIEYLRIINPRIAGVATRGDTAYLDIGLEKMMPLNMFGSGMVHSATILSHCILGGSAILLLEELEYGLHYQAMVPLLETLLKLATGGQVQIFATTHSHEVLKGLRQVLREERCAGYRRGTNAYALQKDQEGLVRSYRYGYDQLDHCMAKGLEIR